MDCGADCREDTSWDVFEFSFTVAEEVTVTVTVSVADELSSITSTELCGTTMFSGFSESLEVFDSLIIMEVNSELVEEELVLLSYVH